MAILFLNSQTHTICILQGNSAEIKRILKVLPLTRNQMGGILKELCGVDIMEFSSNSFSQNW